MESGFKGKKYLVTGVGAGNTVQFLTILWEKILKKDNQINMKKSEII
jgi:hypothetical protein